MTDDFKNLLTDGILNTVANEIVALTFNYRGIQPINKANQNSFRLSVELNDFFWIYLLADLVKIFFFKMKYQILFIFAAVKWSRK